MGRSATRAKPRSGASKPSAASTQHPTLAPPPPLDIPDLMQLDIPDLSGLDIPDLSGLDIPDLSGLDIPDLSGLDTCSFTPKVHRKPPISRKSPPKQRV